MVIHAEVKGGKAAPCGYEYRKHLMGLDFSKRFDRMAPHHVTCLECLKHAPRKPPHRASGKVKV